MTTETTPDGMRAAADQLAAGVREDSRDLLERQRQAAQLRYVAGLIDDAELCLAALTGARDHLYRLQDAVEPAVTAERKAEDRLRADERHLARRRAEAEKLRADYAPASRQEEAAIRVHVAEGVVASGEQAVAAARASREQAQAALASHEVYVAGRDRDHAEAERKVANPGRAPSAPGIRLGTDGMSDLDEDQQRLMQLAVLAIMQSGTFGGSTQPAAKSGLGTTRGNLLSQSDKGFRLVRAGSGVLAIPPAPAR